MHTRLFLPLTIAGLLSAPAAAQADSIVYVDGGNVVTSRPDGTGRVQLTEGGDWHSPTQADDGTIAAVKGTGPIQLMARDGRPIRTITTQPAPSSSGGTFAARPVELSLSPDGRRLAYTYTGLGCPVASTCGQSSSVLYTDTSGEQATPQAVYGNQFSRSAPEWVTNDRALVFGGAGSHVNLDDVGGGDDSNTNWWNAATDISDGELTRDGRRLGLLIGYGDDTRLVSRVKVLRTVVS